MPLDKVETDTTYQHERYGEVFVTGIGELYDEWKVNGNGSTEVDRNTVVFFHEMAGGSAAPISQDVNEFAKCASLRSAVGGYE